MVQEFAGPKIFDPDSERFVLIANDLDLTTRGLPPNQFVMYYYGAGTTQTAFGNGWRCVSAGGIYRFRPLQSDITGFAMMPVDFEPPSAGTGGGLGQWLPGDRWLVQAWYRDPAAVRARPSRARAGGRPAG